jgi:hypothetical protein
MEKNTYEYHGTFIYIVQADSKEKAQEIMDRELGECLYEWSVKETYHEEDGE